MASLLNGPQLSPGKRQATSLNTRMPLGQLTEQRVVERLVKHRGDDIHDRKAASDKVYVASLDGCTKGAVLGRSEMGFEPRE